MFRHNTSDADPRIVEAFKIMAVLHESRKDDSKPLVIEYGYENEETGERKAVRITIEDNDRPVEDFGGTSQKGDSKWGLGI